MDLPVRWHRVEEARSWSLPSAGTPVVNSAGADPSDGGLSSSAVVPMARAPMINRMISTSSMMAASQVLWV
jgi:hypothetical protein